MKKQSENNNEVLTDPEPTNVTSHSGVAHATIPQHVRKTWKHITGQDLIDFEGLAITVERREGRLCLVIQSGKLTIEVNK